MKPKWDFSIRERILEAAVSIVVEEGWPKLVRDKVAQRSRLSSGSINNAFGTMPKLRDAVVMALVERDFLTEVAEAVSLKIPAAVQLPPAVKKKALAKVLDAG